MIQIPWFKVDDKFHSHPKVMELPPSAIGVWTLAGTWCADYLTDGEIRPGQLRRLGGTVDDAALLIEAGLWEATEDGYKFRDWTDYQPTREAVTADKEVSKRRWAMNNNPELRKIVRGRDGDTCRYCQKRVNWSDRRSAEGGTYDHVLPLSKGGDESPENIVVACRDCNVKKGARTPDQAGVTLHPPKSNLDKSQNTSRSVNSHTRPPEPVPVPEPKEEPLNPSDSAEPLDTGQEIEAPREDVEKLCQHLQQRIIQLGSKKPDINKSWRDNARLLIDKDKRTEEEAHRLIDWCMSDGNFWQPHIGSMKKFREKYDTMRLQAQNPQRPGGGYMNSAEKKVDVARHWLSQPAQNAPHDPWAIDTSQRKEIGA